MIEIDILKMIADQSLSFFLKFLKYQYFDI